MRGKALRVCARIILLLAVLPPAEIARAQAVDVEKPERGSIEIGVRQLYGDRRSAKFNEYRDIPQGVFIRHAEVDLHDLFQRGFFFNLQSRDTRENDQTYLIGLGISPKYRLDLRWDETPHVFTTTAKSFFVESSSGIYTAPALVRGFLENQPSSDRESSLQAVLDSARPLDMSLRRYKGSGLLTLTPKPEWTISPYISAIW
jgi:Putative outer membrane beta-barrel porin, MtrB/PioB